MKVLALIGERAGRALDAIEARADASSLCSLTLGIGLAMATVLGGFAAFILVFLFLVKVAR